jgi:hypothetical protein
MVFGVLHLKIKDPDDRRPDRQWMMPSSNRYDDPLLSV